jgi:hypothetical protein
MINVPLDASQNDREHDQKPGFEQPRILPVTLSADQRFPLSAQR